MQITKLKEVGEVISILAVLVTLVFLILEVRENTAAIRTEAYGGNITRMNDWRMQLADNPDLSKMFALFNEGQLPGAELDLTQRQQFVRKGRLSRLSAPSTSTPTRGIYSQQPSIEPCYSHQSACLIERPTCS